jgi:hypothetical protein
VLNALMTVTGKGSRPFAALCDWNCTTQEIKESGWLQLLHAQIVATGQRTAVTREVDFAIVSCELGKAWLGCSLNWATPFSPHASFRLVLSRRPGDMSKMIPRRPRPLPAVGPEVLHSSWALAKWLELRRRTNSQRATETEGTSVLAGFGRSPRDFVLPFSVR